MPIKVAIYEDNNSLRESLGYLIMGTNNLELCGSYADCLSVIENTSNQRPDVILMDIDLPQITGIEATIMIKEKFPEINIMMLTVYEQKDKIFEALCAGATGYLLKKTPSVQIIEAVEELYNGGSPMSGEIARKVMNFFPKQQPNKENPYQISDREMDILRCLTNGDSYKMIADKCFISIGTVRTHINSIYKKLHVNSKSEAVIKAMKENIV